MDNKTIKSENHKQTHENKSKTNEKPTEYIKITCPVKSCKEELILACPYCHKGALRCDNDHADLYCESCQNSLHGINCRCGFIVQTSYVKKKYKQLLFYQENLDMSGYKTIGYALLSITTFAWIISIL